MVAAAVVALAVAASAGGWLWLRPDAEAVATSTTQTVSTSTFEQTVTASGTLRAARSEDLSFAVAGTVRAVLVSEGDRVRRGTALARVDATSLVAARTAARSSYDAALTQLDEDLDAGASDVQVAADRSSVVAAKASWVEAREAVDDAVLRAPMAGTVVALDLAVGDTVGSGSSSGSSSGTGSAGGSTTGSNSTSTSTGTSTSTATSSAQVTIATTRRFAVDAEVAAADIEGVQEGLQVELTVSGVDEAVYGTVASVGAVASTNSSGAAVFPVEVEVTGNRKDLYSGTSADLSIVVSQRTDVLTVPTRAVGTEDGQAYVTLEVDGKEVRRDIEIGEASGASTEVTSGLAEGDTVVVPAFSGPGAGTGSDDGGQQGFPGGTPPSGMPSFPGGGQMPGAPQ
ncbi:efflux RND transporter periplasmic adaptor subunit [Nocardioides exalbidus]|uniref:efflux RND transporter periplasmic adaptor subunit n=1 Tax=Nocardioides exalbidus TaxID=402596 RepID=UPI000B84BCCD|nr:HlyD family efflux transporter periplasmic adaptor subunit [Nocardioides exalbidus]